MAYQYYLTVKGSKQGDFPGDKKKDKDKRIAILGYTLAASKPVDAGSGMATGKHTYEPLVVYKDIGNATVQFFQAFVTGEVLAKVVVQAVRLSAKGKEEPVLTITLTNALVVEFEHEPEFNTGGAGTNTGELEMISFNFQKIDVLHNPSQTLVEDNFGGLLTW